MKGDLGPEEELIFTQYAQLDLVPDQDLGD